MQYFRIMQVIEDYVFRFYAIYKIEREIANKFSNTSLLQKSYKNLDLSLQYNI